MLVLSRKQNERIIIGDNIEITVVDVRGDRVKLGFTCPPDIPVHREEVYRQIHQGLAAAAAGNLPSARL